MDVSSNSKVRHLRISLLQLQNFSIPVSPHKCFEQNYSLVSKCILLLTSLSKDIERGQCFFPESELKKFGLTSLNENSAKQNPEEFAAFMKLQLNRYHVWQDEARKGDAFMPKKLRPIINRCRAWQEFVAKRIEKDPLSVFGNSFSYRLPNRIRARVGMLKK